MNTSVASCKTLQRRKRAVIGVSMLLVTNVAAQSLEGNHALETITITGDAEERESAPGSLDVVEEEAMQRWRYTDIHRVLSDTPGIYVRQEDGWGLRPNIGMRGAGSDRSSKIALTEDGILFAPAPYSAPAAYYFPLLGRIQAVEVFKGPASIRNGPNTVGGIVNFVSRDVPGTNDEEDVQASLDLSVGQHGIANVHGYYGDSSDTFGYLIEGVHLQADGFQDIDGGTDSGFDKNDVMLKLRFNSDLDASTYHQFDLKLGYADEVSQQSYLGLTDEDFSITPFRRYAGGQLDEMTWDHQQFSLSHFLDTGADYFLTTTLYYRQFHRIWDKLNGFEDDAPALQDILDNPGSAVNSVFYDVLSGIRDSSSPAETLLLGANEREFFSRGIQTNLELDVYTDRSVHQFNLGVRLHEDQIDRSHTEQGYLMVDGLLVEDINPRQSTTTNRANTRALAAFIHDRIEWNRFVFTGGLRAEFINSTFDDFLADTDSVEREERVWIPGAGFAWEWRPKLRLIGGVHKGFVPATPGSAPEVEPEQSVNYELGVRYSDNLIKAEIIGFFNDYSNLSGTCTFSSGCASTELDIGFNAGEVDIYGIEAQIGGKFSRGIERRISFPFQLSWTYTDSEIRNTFTSPSPELADVTIGDQLPYLPEQQVSATIGVERFDWQAAFTVKYVASMRTIAGQGTPDTLNRTDSYTVVDAVVRYQIADKQQLHLSLQNLLDEQAITARRPFGARGLKPSTVTLGYKIDF